MNVRQFVCCYGFAFVVGCAPPTDIKQNDGPGDQAGMPPPLTLSDFTATTSEDTPLGLELPALEGVSFEIVTPPSHGVLAAITGRTTTYSPAANFNGTDMVRIAAVRQGARAEANVVITVSPVNDAVSAGDDALSANEGATVSGNVTSNDSDVDGDAVVTLTAQPARGTLVLTSDGAFTYVHDGSESPLSDSFVYSFSDGTTTVSATVTIAITVLNDPPLATSDTFSVAEGDTFVGPVPGVMHNDSDDENMTLTVLSASGTAHGTLVMSLDGSFTYTHDGSETTNDAFVYTLSDGTNTATGIVDITITAVNDPPVAVADALTVNEGGTATMLRSSALSLLANDTDAENDTLAAQILPVSGPLHGTLTIGTDGTFSYTHDGGETTTDSFTYRCNDGSADSNTATVSITITPQNDAPVTTNKSFTVAEGGTGTQANLSGVTGLINGSSDVDTPLGNLSVSTTLQTAPAHGSVTINSPAGAFTYNHDGSETTSDSFQFQVVDGVGGIGVGTVNITITPVNDVPILSLTIEPTVTTSGGLLPLQLDLIDPDSPSVTIDCQYQIGAGGFQQVSAPNTFPSTIRAPGSSLGVQLPLSGLSPESVTANVQARCRGSDGSGFTAYATSNTATVNNRAVLYVDGTLGSGADNGTSWANAYRGATSLNRALAAAAATPPSYGREVWVADATYTPQPSGGTTGRDVNFLVLGGVHVYGGFARTETHRAQRVLAGHETILSGVIGPTNAYHVVQVRYDVAPSGPQGPTNATINGFTIRDGQADINSGSANFRAYGGGIVAQVGMSSTLNLGDLVLRDNQALLGGAALALRANISGVGRLTVNANRLDIYNNQTAGAGVILTDGIQFTRASFANLSVHDNTLSTSSVIYLHNFLGYMEHVTITRNQVGPSRPVIMSCLVGTSGVGRSIIWGNTFFGALGVPPANGHDPAGGCFNTPNVVPLAMSDLQSSGGSSNWQLGSGDLGGNIDADPLFVSATDFHLNGASPALEAPMGTVNVTDSTDSDMDGSTTDPLPFDFDRTSRRKGPERDMGCYERTLSN